MSSYLKGISGNSIPRRTWYVVAETVRQMDEFGKEIPYCKGVAVWAMYRYRSPYGYSGHEEPKRYTLKEFWIAFARSLHRGTRTYLVSPIASDFLTLSKFWNLVSARYFRINHGDGNGSSSKDTKKKYKRGRGERLIMSGTPDIITFSRKGSSCKALSFSNYIQTSWKDIFDSTGWKTAKLYSEEKHISWMDYDPSDICNSMRLWLEECMLDWRERNIGPWQDTVGELALTIYRSAFCEHKLLRHDDESALAIEESGLYGGRACAFYLGDIGDRGLIGGHNLLLPKHSEYQMPDTGIHKLDVSSMYPALLRDREFPIKLKSVLYDVSVRDAIEIAEYYGVIASCLVKPRVPEYPHRIKENVAYPYGRFVSTLAGPELTTACGAGEVESIIALCKYEMAPAFRDWGEYVISSRVDCRSFGNKSSELFWKCIANSFGGKFAQRKRRWEYQPNSVPPFEWGEYLVLIDHTGEVKRMRAIAGKAYCLVEGKIGNRLPASVYVYLCAYGRYAMRCYRNEIGHENVLSQDTDGIFVNDAGLDRAYSMGVTTAKVPGKLCHISSHKYARFFDARHYCLDGEWTLAGIRDGFEVIDNNLLRERVTANPVRSGSREYPSSMLDTRREVRMDRIANQQIVNEKGWMVSPIVNEIPEPPIEEREP